MCELIVSKSSECILLALLLRLGNCEPVISGSFAQNDSLMSARLAPVQWCLEASDDQGVCLRLDIHVTVL